MTKKRLSNANTPHRTGGSKKRNSKRNSRKIHNGKSYSNYAEMVESANESNASTTSATDNDLPVDDGSVESIYVSGESKNELTVATSSVHDITVDGGSVEPSGDPRVLTVSSNTASVIENDTTTIENDAAVSHTMAIESGTSIVSNVDNSTVNETNKSVSTIECIFKNESGLTNGFEGFSTVSTIDTIFDNGPNDTPNESRSTTETVSTNGSNGVIASITNGSVVCELNNFYKSLSETYEHEVSEQKTSEAMASSSEAENDEEVDVSNEAVGVVDNINEVANMNVNNASDSDGKTFKSLKDEIAEVSKHTPASNMNTVEDVDLFEVFEQSTKSPNVDDVSRSLIENKLFNSQSLMEAYSLNVLCTNCVELEEQISDLRVDLQKKSTCTVCDSLEMERKVAIDSWKNAEDEFQSQKLQMEETVWKRNEINRLNELIVKLQKSIQTRNNRVDTSLKELEGKEITIKRLSEQLKEKVDMEGKANKEKQEIQEKLERKDSAIINLQKELVEKDGQLRNSLTNVSELMVIGRNLKEVIVCRDGKIEELQTEKETLHADVNTLSSSISQVREENVILKNKSKSTTGSRDKVTPIETSEVTVNNELSRFIQDMTDFKKFVHNRLGVLDDMISKGPVRDQKGPEKPAIVLVDPNMPPLEQSEADVASAKVKKKKKKKKKKNTKPYANDDNQYGSLKQLNKGNCNISHEDSSDVSSDEDICSQSVKNSATSAPSKNTIPVKPGTSSYSEIAGKKKAGTKYRDIRYVNNMEEKNYDRDRAENSSTDEDDVVRNTSQHHDISHKQPHKTIVFSTSMTKTIRVNEFNRFYENGKARFQKFHGGRVRHMKKYVKGHMKEEKPDTIVFHGGGNDLPTSKENPLPVLTIANDIIEAGLLCRNYGARNIFISGVISRKQQYTKDRCTELNDLLVSLCKLHKFYYIENDNILADKHLYDGVHLNEEGTILFANNLLDNLNAI